MNICKSLAFIAFLSIVCLSCNKEEDMPPAEVTGSASFSVSGNETASFDFDEEVEFLYSVSTVEGGEISSLEIYMGNIGTTPVALKISIVEQGNSVGFKERKYTYEELASSSTDAAVAGMSSLYVTETSAYSINPETAAVNYITYTKITDSKIEGSFEVNLEDAVSGAGEKVKITGTFEAVGEAFTL